MGEIEGIRVDSAVDAFERSLVDPIPGTRLSGPLQALWWDGKGDWVRAHALVDELETTEGMAVHAYLHRKEGEQSNADYWYKLAGRVYCRPGLKEEWRALVAGLLER